MSRVDDAYRRRSGSTAPSEVPKEPNSPVVTGLDRYPREERGSAVPVSKRAGRDSERRERARPEPVRARAASSDGLVAISRGTQVAPPLDQESANPTTFVLSTLRVFGRRKWLMMTVFAVAAATSVSYMRSIAPIFLATARLTVELWTPSDALLKTQQEGGPQQGYVETLAEVLRSRSLAEVTARKLELAKHADYAKLAASGPVGGDGSTVPDGVVDRFMANTIVAAVPGSTVINLSVRSGDPQLAAKAANALAHEFIERDLQSRLAGAKNASDWLGRRLEEQRTRVTETEAALQRYRETRNADSLDDRQNMVVQRLGDLNAAVTRARTERIAKEALYTRVTELQDTRDLLDSVPAIAANGYIQQLKAQLDQAERQLTEASAVFGARHPEIIRLTMARDEAARRLDTEIATVAESMRNDLLAAQASEDSLTTALEAQKRDSRDLDRKGVEYAALVREAESNRALYQSLLEQAKNVGLAGDLQRSNVRILDEAPVPRAPIGPIGRMAMLLAVLASAAFAAGLGFVVEYLDPRLRTVDETPEQLQLPLLGHLESLRGTKNDRSRTLFPEAPPRFKEAVKYIRAMVENEAGARSGVLLISSTTTKEGKTLVASNIALALAAADRKVLLIDGDLRRSQVHSVFQMPLEPGLASYLTAETVSLDDIARPVSSRLSVVTAGASPANPAELLESAAFAEFLRVVRADYDWVVIDSPPVMAVADGHILASRADYVVFVASADHTRLNAARLAIGQLRRARTNLIGVVLNRVAMPRWVAFSSPYYGSYYNSYYSGEERSKTSRA